MAAGFHGEYWSTEGDNDTFITIKNITDKPATAWVSLQYDAGRGEYDLPPMVLQAAESHMIDLRMIQKEGMPGASGELLPETAVYGGLKLREEPGGRHFLIDTVVFNPKTATCGVCGFGCLYATYINIPGGLYIVALADSGELIVVNAHMCDGTNQTGWECVSEFSTDDGGVATVDPWCQSRGYGITGGSTTIRGTARDIPGPHCGEQTLLASLLMQVIGVRYTNVTSDFGSAQFAQDFTGHFASATLSLQNGSAPCNGNAFDVRVNLTKDFSATLYNHQDPRHHVETPADGQYRVNGWGLEYEDTSTPSFWARLQRINPSNANQRISFTVAGFTSSTSFTATGRVTVTCN